MAQRNRGRQVSTKRLGVPEYDKADLDEPLFVLTVGDLQTAALDKLGRHLTEAELKVIMKTLVRSLDWLTSFSAAIDACRIDGTVGPSVAEQEHLQEDLPAPPDEGESFPLPTPELAPYIAYLVYYRLTGMTLTHAASEVEASKSVFAALHRLVGRAGTEGVTAEEAKSLRLSDLEAYIESVESTEFPLDEA